MLVASNLGRLFDAFEIYAVFLTVGFALHQLLVLCMWAQSMGALLAAVTVFGFFTGGIWA